jgi:hypothetical protein
MTELKQYRLYLQAAIVRSIVWTLAVLAGVVLVVGVGAVLLEFQLSSAVQHADAGISGKDGLLASASLSVLNVGNASTVAIADETTRLNVSLGSFDHQLATVGPVVQQLGGAIGDLSRDEAKLGASLDLVNARCVPGPCGTIADVGKTLNTVRGTFGQIEVAANHEDRNLTTLDAQELQLFTDFHGTETRLNTGLDTADALLANPNIAYAMDSGAGILHTGELVEQKLAACTLHPTAKCMFKSDAIFVAQVGGYLLH